MSLKFLSGIDLGQLELLNARIQNLASDPGSPVEGQIWVNTTSHLMKWYNGSGNIDPLARANHSGTQAFSTLTSLPSTLAGHGITDAATLASPTFTGTVTIPTASAGDSTTKAASTAYVRGEITSLIAGAPGALDTLNELSAALGNDANYASTITTALALKAPLASPTLTGTPLAPTASGGTNTTQIATTAFVTAALVASGAPLRYSSDVGDGSTTAIVVTHSLGTRDVHVSVRKVASPYTAAMVDWAATSTSTITVTFDVAPTTAQYRVTVIA